MANHPTLRKGSTGHLVTYLQGFLAGEFADSMVIRPAVSGTFDDDTHTCVEAFQARYALDVDGVVGPDTWAVILDMDPTTAEWGDGADPGQTVIDMPPMLVGERFEEPSDGSSPVDPMRDWEDRLALNASYMEWTTNWEVLDLVPLVDERFQEAAGGYALTAFEWDPSHGYDTAVLRLWFEQLGAVTEVTAANLRRTADIVGDNNDAVRADPPDYAFEGFVATLGEFLGGAEEPNTMWFVERVDEHLAAFTERVDAGRLKSAAESLGSAINVVGLYFAAWEDYQADTLQGVRRLQTTLEITEEVAKEILLTAATGGVGKLVQGGGRLARAGLALGTRVVGGASLTIIELGVHVLHGTDDQFDLDAELKKALRDAVLDGAGEFASTLVTYLPADEWITARFVPELDDVLRIKVRDYDRWQGLSGRVVRALGGTMAEAAVVTTVEVIEDGEIDGTGDLVTRVMGNFAEEGWKNVVGSAVERLGDPVDRLEDELVSVLRAELDERASRP